jgi:hypothetical protein
VVYKLSNREVIPVVAIGLVSFGIFYIIFSYIINGFVGVVNQCIDLQMMSQVTVDHFSTMLLLWKFSPFAFLVGLFFFVVETGRGSEGLTAQRFYAYERLLIMGITASLIMLMAYGLICDVLDSAIIAANVRNNLSPVYDSSFARFMCIQGIYILASLIGYVSAGLFMIHPLTRQTDYLIWNDFSSMPGNQPQDFVTNYQNDQF